MKDGEIVCWQMLLYPMPIYGREDTYRARIKFTDKKYLYTQRGGLFEPIAYWRIKKIKKPTHQSITIPSQKNRELYNHQK